jgi:hypothetical protein
VTLLKFAVPIVDRPRHVPQVLPPVVQRIPIFMVNVVLGPFSSHPKPDDPVCAVHLVVDRQHATMSVVARLDATDLLAVAPAAFRLSPSQLASGRVIRENCTDVFGG